MYKQDNKNYDTNRIRRICYHERLKMLACCSKEWTFNNADYIDTLMLNQMLFEENAFVICKDEYRDKPFICGKLTGVSDFDEYFRPTRWGMVTLNGQYNRTDLNEENSVIVYASPVRYGLTMNPTLKETVYLFADRLALIDAVKRINIQAQKTPYLITPSPETGINVKHMVANIQNCSDLVMNASSSILDEQIKVADLTAPWVADKLTEIEHDTYNQFYTFLGLNNANVDKRERVNVLEVTANNGVIELYQYCAMKTLIDGCDKINKLWPELNVEVKPTVNLTEMVRGSITDTADETMIDNQHTAQRGDDNGNVHG